MLLIIKKLLKKDNAVFKILEPDIDLTASLPDCMKKLKAAKVKYSQVCAGYIVFPAKLFDGLEMMVGLHYTDTIIEYIEIFRPLEYYDSSDFDIKKSFSEIHNSVVSCYGRPQVVNTAILSENPSEKWIGKNFVLEHYIFDRFGEEEHLHFYFSHRINKKRCFNR